MTTRELAIIAQVRDDFRTGRARTVRLAARISLAEASSAAHFTAPVLWRYEQGQRTPSARQALAYAGVLARLAAQVRG